MRFSRPISAGVAILALLGASPALANDCVPVSAIPQTLADGNFCLTFDVGVQGLTPIRLESNASIDCRGHKIRDLGGASTSFAIYATGNNISIRNCVIEGFDDPITLNGAKGYSVLDNVLLSNESTSRSITAVGSSDQGLIARNRMINNQPFVDHYWAIFVNSGTVDIVDNVVGNAIAQPGSGASMYGISTYSSMGGLIAGNVVRNLVPDGLQAISLNMQYGRNVLRDNLLLNAGEGDIGIFCYSGDYVVQGGFELGFGTPRQGGC